MCSYEGFFGGVVTTITDLSFQASSGQGIAKAIIHGKANPMDVMYGFDIQVHHRNQVYSIGHTI
jgi:hypothetical protein